MQEETKWPPSPWIRRRSLTIRNGCWPLEVNEEFERNQKYTQWPIATMVHRKVAVVGLNYASSQFISHGCREVVFSIPVAPGRVWKGRQPQQQRIKVRDTLRVQDFVTIRRKENTDATMFLQTIAVTPAIVSRITNTEVAVRLKDDMESHLLCGGVSKRHHRETRDR